MDTTANSTKEQYIQALNILKPFCKKNIKRALFQAIFTFIMVQGLLISSYFLYEINVWLSVALIPVTAIFMCRSYVIEHDCGHQSFFRTKVQNAIAGNILAFPILIPYSMWKYIHNSHHMNVGNLDKRDLNPEVLTMTVKEFKAAPTMKRVAYRFLRSKFFRFLVAPWAIFAIIFRFPNKKFDFQANVSVIVYDLLYVLLFVLFFKYITLLKLAIVYLLPVFLFLATASYVFYAQHQFEDTYWENQEQWTYEEATFKGSTYLTSPRWFNWVSGNVVYHNIHHLISSIPNYNLEKAQLALGTALEFKPISIFKVYDLLDLKLWDEDKKKMVGFESLKSNV